MNSRTDIHPAPLYKVHFYLQKKPKKQQIKLTLVFHTKNRSGLIPPGGSGVVPGPAVPPLPSHRPRPGGRPRRLRARP